ncbi:hypothetical protein CRG98_012831 [Punica granatum]|uniref:Uncharacterized protein n=1 Tax=Punica granatum TaxID=22663 RepID=A0A2I0KE88_PUNGR|nr:hypothetical protein CRG98_012831 [Punica granatum]
MTSSMNNVVLEVFRMTRNSFRSPQNHLITFIFFKCLQINTHFFPKNSPPLKFNLDRFRITPPYFQISALIFIRPRNILSSAFDPNYPLFGPVQKIAWAPYSPLLLNLSPDLFPKPVGQNWTHLHLWASPLSSGLAFVAELGRVVPPSWIASLLTHLRSWAGILQSASVDSWAQLRPEIMGFLFLVALIPYFPWQKEKLSCKTEHPSIPIFAYSSDRKVSIPSSREDIR